MHFDPTDTQWDLQVQTSQSLPDGEHVVFVSDVRCGTANSGTKFIELEFCCHDPESKYTGKRLGRQSFWLSEKAMPRLVKFCRAAGVPRAFNPTDEVDAADALIDRILRVVVKTKSETYKGETRTKTEAAFFSKLKPTDVARLQAHYGDTMLPPLGDDEVETKKNPRGSEYDGLAAASGEYADRPGFADDDVPF